MSEPINPTDHPEFGPQLLWADLFNQRALGAFVVILHAPHRPDTAMTAWVHSISPLHVIFYAGDVKAKLSLRVQPDGTLHDDAHRAINVYTWKQPTN